MINRGFGWNALTSEKVPELEARVDLTHKQAMIRIDGSILCTMDMKSQGVDIGDRHFNMRFGKNDTIEARTEKVMRKLETYFNSPKGLEKRYSDSSLMKRLSLEFKAKNVMAYKYKHAVRAGLDLGDSALKEVYRRSGLEAKLGVPFDRIKTMYQVNAWVYQPSLTKQASLRMALIRSSGLRAKNLKAAVRLSPSEKKTLGEMLNDYAKEGMVKRTPEEAFAEKRSRAAKSDRA